jgi:hypothetical protein
MGRVYGKEKTRSRRKKYGEQEETGHPKMRIRALWVVLYKLNIICNDAYWYKIQK